MDLIENSDETLIRSSSTTPSPEELRSVSSGIDLTFNGKTSPSINKKILDLTQSYTEFMIRFNEFFAKKTNVTTDTLEGATKTILWLWMTRRKAQNINLPKFNAFESEEHYELLQRDIRATARRNPDLDNMVLRFNVDIKLSSNDINTMEARSEPTSKLPPVYSHFEISNCSAPPPVQVMPSQRPTSTSNILS